MSLIEITISLVGLVPPVIAAFFAIRNWFRDSKLKMRVEMRNELTAMLSKTPLPLSVKNRVGSIKAAEEYINLEIAEFVMSQVALRAKRQLKTFKSRKLWAWVKWGFSCLAFLVALITAQFLPEIEMWQRGLVVIYFGFLIFCTIAGLSSALKTIRRSDEENTQAMLNIIRPAADLKPVLS